MELPSVLVGRNNSYSFTLAALPPRSAWKAAKKRSREQNSQPLPSIK